MSMHDVVAPRRTFPCTGCGACCRHVGLAEETRFLDRGDGTCRHFDEAGRSCAIYAERPLVCRVDRYYDAHYVHLVGWDEFIELNLMECARLAAMDEATSPD